MMGARSVVLMYHRLGDPRADAQEGDYALPPSLFEAQMRWLAGSGRPVIPLAALLGGPRPDRSVVLTFDDGCDTDAAVAAPLLAALGLPAAFFVNPGRIGRPGYLSWDEIRDLAARGFDVGSHGLDHSLLGDLPEPELRRQLVESKRRLEEKLDRRIDALSLPGGSGGSRALRAARAAGYRLVLGSRPGLARGAGSEAVLPRFAIRRDHGIEWVRAAVEQRELFRLRQGLRYGVACLARDLVGTGAYGRLRALWLRRSAGPGPEPGR
jgi:peptidoglycan/xylan/chitin deacetylase (PgdA/CDA1 family)